MREAREVMADLAASGLTPEQMALMMELTASLAAEARPVKDEAAERRRIRDREYQAAKREQDRANRQTSADSADTLSPSPLSPQTPLTPHPHTRNNNPARVRGTRLDVQWRPEPLSGEAGEKVAEHGQKWAKIQFEAFQNHWLAKSGRDACKLDWQRTWANWIINANPPKAAFGQPPPQSMDNKLIELRRRYGTQ